MSIPSLAKTSSLTASKGNCINIYVLDHVFLLDSFFNPRGLNIFPSSETHAPAVQNGAQAHQVEGCLQPLLLGKGKSQSCPISSTCLNKSATRSGVMGTRKAAVDAPKRSCRVCTANLE